MRCRLSLLLATTLLTVGLATVATPASASLLAPLDACPGQVDLDAPADTQKRAMTCLIDFARRQVGLPGLVEAGDLDWSAQAKSGDILHCNSFSHFACGRDFTYWMRQSGYLSARCWRAAENLAWGIRGAGTVRSIVRALLNSPPHRHNILGPFERMGVGLRIGHLKRRRGTHVWTQHFGSHCAPSRAKRGSGKI